MEAFGGSMTYTTFHVQGEVGQDFRDTFIEGIQREAFSPLSVEAPDEESVGWVAIEHPFDVDLDYDKVFYNSYLNLTLRIDRWRIPGPIYKAFFTDAARQRLAETKKNKLSKREKEDIKAVVIATLRRQLIPAMMLVDLSWNLDTGVLRFWNGSTRIHDILEELFESSFGLRLLRDAPYVVGANAGLEPKNLEALLLLDPTPIHNLGSSNVIATPVASDGEE